MRDDAFSYPAILGTDYEWLASEAAAVAEREAAYDDVDGVGDLWGNSSDSEGSVEKEDEDAESRRFSQLFSLGRARRWKNPADASNGMVFQTSSRASGHGDVLWAAGEYIASRVLAADYPWPASAAQDEFSLRQSRPSINDIPTGGVRVCELGAGAGLPSER